MGYLRNYNEKTFFSFLPLKKKRTNISIKMTISPNEIITVQTNFESKLIQFLSRFNLNLTAVKSISLRCYFLINCSKSPRNRGYNLSRPFPLSRKFVPRSRDSNGGPFQGETVSRFPIGVCSKDGIIAAILRIRAMARANCRENCRNTRGEVGRLYRALQRLASETWLRIHEYPRVT